MLIAEIVAVVIVGGVVVAILLRRRSHDDVHSVEHYHRQLHTLEEIRTHPNGDGQNGRDPVEFPASAFRVSGSSTVRLTEPGRTIVPPAPPPPVPNPSEPVTFDDASPEPVPATFMTGNEDRVIHSINHRPRRLGGPAAAVAAVAVLVAVLIVTGLHSNTPPHHGQAATTTTVPTQHHHAATTSTSTTTTTAPPAVSAPTTATAHSATYQVPVADYSLTLAATTGECWVEATDTASGSVLFTATLLPGQSHAIAATGPVTVIAGAPGAFSATVNGAPVTLPPGNQAPFTLLFRTAPAPSTT